MEYVWGLHPFVPEHDDEIDFKVGERILVIEKDDIYQDGWWKGTNAAGNNGLFPQSYTTSVPPVSVNTSTPSKLAGQAGTLTALAEDDEPESSPDDKDAGARIIVHQPQPIHAVSDQTQQPGTVTVLHATMTDIQEAIEQLGVRPDSAGGGSRSFSFASTKDDTVTDDDYDGVDETEFATGWSKDARSRLAANAAKQQTAINNAREAALHQPPIEVELSDESEDDGEQHLSLSTLGASFAYDAARSIPDLIQATADAQAAVNAAKAEEDAPMTARPHANGHGHVRHESEATIAHKPSFNNAQPQAIPRIQKTSESTINTITSLPVAHASSREQLTAVVPVPPSDKDEALPVAQAGDPTPPASVTAAQAVRLPSSSLMSSPVVTSSNEAVVRAPSPAAPAAPIVEPAAAIATASSPVPTSPASESGKSANPPSEWTIEEVVAWLRSKKFDEGVCAKFTEHEITGDVLLDLDVNMLKEVDITAFGKRMRIANAIAELRRPPSMMSYSAPQSFALSTSGQSRTDDGLIYSPESAPHTGDFVGTPITGLSDSRNGRNLPGPLTLAPSDNSSTAKAMLTGTSMTTIVNDVAREAGESKDETIVAESETVSSHTNTKGSKTSKMFGRSAGGSVSSTHSLPGGMIHNDVHAKHQSKDSTLTASTSKSASSTPTSPEEKSKDKEKGKGTVSAIRGHLVDGSRHSFFGGSIGKSRKPAPRYSESHDTSETQNKPSRSLSRLYLTGSGHKRSRISGSTPPSSGAYGGSDTFQTLSTPTSEGDSPGAHAVSPLSPPDSVNNADPLNIRPGRSVVDQIGTPDREGWMRKKGERYNTWKLRYFVLRGPHLYYLRNRSETKIKGYINIKGYRIMADENANPGRYGFRIFHEGGATHWFSSDEQFTIREWMKALMKATIGRDYSKPVMSSVNIPTIPLQVAQAMSPAPRPPSPTQRDATQRALRRDNPNQLSTRDARILMGLPSEAGGSSIATTPTITDGPSTPALTPTQATSPGRPVRDAARPDPRRRNPALEQAQDAELIVWINRHIPNSSHKATDMSKSLATGLVLYRLAESIKMNGESDKGNRADYGIPDVPDSVFPSSPNDDKLDGLFILFDFLLDNDVRMGNVTINDVRSGDRDQLVVLVKALKAWEDKNKELENQLTRQAVAFGVYTSPL